MHDVHVRFLLEHLGVELKHAAGTIGGIGQLARILLGFCNQFAQRIGLHLRIGQDQNGQGADLADALESLYDIDLGVFVDGRQGRQFIEGQQQGVAVGLGLRRVVGADQRARARLVLDDDRMAPLHGQFGSDQTGQQIRRAAGSGGHHDGHGPGGIGRRVGGRRRVDSDDQIKQYSRAVAPKSQLHACPACLIND
ncbi:hypothetical protein D3C72_1754910 [compost metagenome]